MTIFVLLYVASVLGLIVAGIFQSGEWARLCILVFVVSLGIIAILTRLDCIAENLPKPEDI